MKTEDIYVLSQTHILFRVPVNYELSWQELIEKAAPDEQEDRLWKVGQLYSPPQRGIVPTNIFLFEFDDIGLDTVQVSDFFRQKGLQTVNPWQLFSIGIEHPKLVQGLEAALREHLLLTCHYSLYRHGIEHPNLLQGLKEGLREYLVSLCLYSLDGRRLPHSSFAGRFSFLAPTLRLDHYGIRKAGLDAISHPDTKPGMGKSMPFVPSSWYPAVLAE